MNTQKRQDLLNQLKNNVLVWFEQTENFTTTDVFVSVSDLSDLELGSLFSDFNWGSNKGIVSTKDRTVNLKWEKR